MKSKVLFVKQVPGISLVDWDVDLEMELHTVLVRKMRHIMANDDPYPYLSPRCAERLAEIKYIARNSGILGNLVTQMSETKFAVFPWVGTRQLMTLHYALSKKRIKNKLPWITSIYLEVYFDGKADELNDIIYDILNSDLNMYELPLPDKVRVLGKYNEFVPQELLRKQFIEDYLDFKGLKEALL